MAVAATSSSSSSSTAPPVVSKDKTGFNALTSEDFLKMMIVQLKNQDPLEPTKNEELLNQISQMRSLQSSTELGDVLKNLSSQQELTSAASLLGKAISGTATVNGESKTIQGIADRAFIKDGDAYVGTGANEIALNDINYVE